MTERTWRDYDTHLMQEGATSNDHFHAVDYCPRIKDGGKTVDRDERYVAFHEPAPCAVCHPEIPTGDGDELVIVPSDRHDASYHRSSFCAGVSQMTNPKRVKLTETDAEPCANCAPADRDGETVVACPECDDTLVRRLVRSDGWTCRAAGCGATFDEPVERPRQGSNDGPVTGLAHELLEADPDAVSADNVGGESA